MAAKPAALTRRRVLATLPGIALAPLAAGGGRMGTPVESGAAATSVAEPAAKAAHIGAAGNLSQPVADLIYDHCVAYAELGQISHQTDAIVLGRQPTSGEWRRLEEACDHERALLIKLCAAPAGTDAERHAKASYLLAIFDDDEPSSEHVAAILGSMMCGRVS